MPIKLVADERLAKGILWHETRVLHSLVCEDTPRQELRVQAAKVLEACTAYELGEYDAAIAHFKESE